MLRSSSINLNNYGRDDAKFIIPMIRNQTVNINEYELVLLKNRPNCHLNTVAADFKPILKEFSTQGRSEKSFESIVPRFNQDGLYFTPSFILPSDESFYLNNTNFEKVKFEERIQNASEKNIIQNQFNIEPAGFYCQPCRQTYQTYMEHINSIDHQRSVQSSSANLLIAELTYHFTKNKCGVIKNRRNSTTKKSYEAVKSGKNQRKNTRKRISKEGNYKGKLLGNWNKNNNQSTNIHSTAL